MPAQNLIRRKEALFKELNLNDANEQTLLSAMADNPSLIERPIVVKGKRAVIGRPPENILELLNE
jgi:arsenate reductase